MATEWIKGEGMKSERRNVRGPLSTDEFDFWQQLEFILAATIDEPVED